MSRLRARLCDRVPEAGFTLIELLVGMTMSVVLLGAIGSMVISAMRAQPQISKRAQSISDARWVMERLTREIRNGVVVDQASSSSVSFQAYVRRTSCGGEGTPAESEPAVKCEVTYTCTATDCTRTEAEPEVFTGTARTIFSGSDSSEVFCYVPSSGEDPTTCGPAPAEPVEVTYIGVTLHIPNPSGGSGVTISDGANLRNATLTN
jgi:prepilin-type N-terminal cleavage/methylation domain-containing protein